MTLATDITTDESNGLITLFIPVIWNKHGGRKSITAPDGHRLNQDRNKKADATLLKALVQAHTWQRMLNDGLYPSISKLCQGEKISKGNIASVMRMVTLAPDIQEAIINATHPCHLTRADFIKGFPALWEEQRAEFGFK